MIRDLTARLARMEEVLAEAAGGNLYVRLPQNAERNDQLSAIETGINLILSDLESETSQRLTLADDISIYKREVGS